MQSTNKRYTYEEAFNESLEYFKGDSLAASVFLNKYAVKENETTWLECSPEQMHHRMASEFARIEKNYQNPLSEDELYSYMKDFKYIIPAGSPMSGIGNDFQKYISLSNCFVIESPHDSFGGIFSTINDMIEVMKRRGGAGLCLSTLRPEGSPVNNSARTSSGMASFMELYSTATLTCGQQSRRGALMLTSHIRHTDAEKFIDAKLDLKKVTGANISVQLDDEFMQCVKNDSEYTQKFPVDSQTPSYTKTIKAKALWNKIIDNAWKSAEPGVLFWDNVLKESIPDCYAKRYPEMKTISTNPCSELPLSDGSCCRLNTLNLYSFVENPFTENATFNFEKLEKCTMIAQRMLDDLIDLDFEKVDNIISKINSDPDPDRIKEPSLRLWNKIKNTGLRERRTGLGITALGDMLAALGYTYGTPEATAFAEKVQKHIALAAFKESVILAKERGAFPVFDYELEKDNPFLNRLYKEDSQLLEDTKKYGRRNVSCLTIAPTGSVSLLCQTTSGIEPVFMPVYKRRRKVNPSDATAHVDFVDKNTGESFEEYIVYHPKLKVWMNINGYDTEKKYSQQELDEIISKSPYWHADANSIDWREKVTMQGKIQKFVDHSISVTINLPNDVTRDTVSELYMMAYENGCKGCTVYRDGSRAGVLVSASDKKEKKDDKKDPKIIEDRPKTLEADVLRFKNNKENWIAFVGLDAHGHPYEIFTGLIDEEDGLFDIPKSVNRGKITKNINEEGKKSYDFEFCNKKGVKIIVEGLNSKFNPMYWNVSKMLSSVLRYQMPINYVLHLLEGLDLGDDSLMSWKSGVKRALKKYVNDGDEVVGGERCPDCGSPMTYESGCATCKNCGYSKCG